MESGGAFLNFIGVKIMKMLNRHYAMLTCTVAFIQAGFLFNYY